MKIYGHGSYVGDTGYNEHTRNFFRELSKHCDIKFRNFTVGKSWEGYSETPHNNEQYINDIDKKILYEQVLWNNVNEKKRSDYKIYKNDNKEFDHDLNLILCETNHYLFYDDYHGPKIAYNVWESTLQPEHFFKKLLEFDELWVPSEWQKECSIKQGYPSDKIKVIPEGVDTNIYFPDSNISHEITSDGRFKFFLVGRWDYRKSTKEIIETFLNTFKKDEPIDLIISVDNPFSNDNLDSTESRLKHYGINDDRIKILHFPSKEEYVRILKSCHVFLSCSRSEGWNLPLIESMACGIPSIYSNCSGQLQFAKNKGLPVGIKGELPVSSSTYNHFNENVGNYYEPDFKDLSKTMRFSYENYNEIKKQSILDSIYIRNEFSWDKVAMIAYKELEIFSSNNSKNENIPDNKIIYSFLDGPKVEILGEKRKYYKVEFIDSDTDKIIFSDTISNNMWTTCSRKYYTNWIIKVNGEITHKFEIENKRVLVSFESKSVGDTLAWAPYVVEFQKQKKCKVILSTFFNHWFENHPPYENIEFINPGSKINCDVVYRIGWFRDNKNGWKNFDSHPNQPNTIPLQKTASDILGLKFSELNHGINFTPTDRKINQKYVVIGPLSTSGCKEWPYQYWDELAEKLTERGFITVSLTQYKLDIKNTVNIVTKDWNEIFNYIYYSEFFIGLSSGLSWVNWALNKKTIMIAGFSRDNHEFQKKVIRISNDVCIKCWNDDVLVFDTGEWDWCPVYKGTEKQHICQKSITPSQVIANIDKKILGV